jgi:hypothetical protein
MADDGRAICNAALPTGGTMKKIAALLVIAAFAASPAAAASKHKKHMAKPKEKESVFAKQSANTMRILRDGAPLVLPTWSLPLYFGMHMDKTGKAEKPKPHHHKMAKKHSKKKS